MRHQHGAFPFRLKLRASLTALDEKHGQHLDVGGSDRPHGAPRLRGTIIAEGWDTIVPITQEPFHEIHCHPCPSPSDNGQVHFDESKLAKSLTRRSTSR